MVELAECRCESPVVVAGTMGEEAPTSLICQIMNASSLHLELYLPYSKTSDSFL